MLIIIAVVTVIGLCVYVGLRYQRLRILAIVAVLVNFYLVIAYMWLLLIVFQVVRIDRWIGDLSAEPIRAFQIAVAVPPIVPWLVVSGYLLHRYAAGRGCTGASINLPADGRGPGRPPRR
jgi:hypothetical protein